MRYLVTGLPYARAIQLQAALNSAGIDAGIIPSALGIYPTEDQTATMQSICAQFDTEAVQGYTNTEARIESLRQSMYPADHNESAG